MQAGESPTIADSARRSEVELPAANGMLTKYDASPAAR